MSELTRLSRRLVDRMDLAERGTAETPVPGVRLFFRDAPVPRAPLLYCSGIVILVSGQKRAYLGERTIVYDRENYLALGLPLAMECETLASKDDPLFAIFIAVDPAFVRDVAVAMGAPLDRPDPRVPAVSPAPLEGEMADAVGRLLRHLCSDSDAAILGEGTVREIVYRALQGPAGTALRGLVSTDSPTARVARVMQTLQTRFPERFSIEDMASMAGMSPSVFHRVFRQVADDTPLQYLKKVRLTEAVTLILHEGYRVGTAANEVGYESAAQFSRDFRSHFGVSAMDARSLGEGFSPGGPLPRTPRPLPRRAPTTAPGRRAEFS